MEVQYAMRAVVPPANGNGFGVEEGKEGMEGCKAGRIGNTRCVQESGQNGFEPGRGGRGVARVDVLFVAVVVELVEWLQSRRVFGISEGGGDMYGRCNIVNDIQGVVCVDCERGWLKVVMGEGIGVLFEWAAGSRLGEVVAFDG